MRAVIGVFADAFREFAQIGRQLAIVEQPRKPQAEIASLLDVWLGGCAVFRGRVQWPRCQIYAEPEHGRGGVIAPDYQTRRTFVEGIFYVSRHVFEVDPGFRTTG
jgi:hypothetical protein